MPDALPTTNGGPHSAGGKIAWPLPPGVVGGATFLLGPDGLPCWRTTLWRARREGSGIALWIGMNPSTAAEDIDDPTVRREMLWTWAWGYQRYVKANVSAYRATNPAILAELDDEYLICPTNEDAIVEAAKAADLVMVTFGKLDGRMRTMAAKLWSRLLLEKVRVHCLGQTADGSPRHQRGVKRDVTPQVWWGWET